MTAARHPTSILMVRSAASRRVSNHVGTAVATSFETRPCGRSLRTRSEGGN
jgi:hypothetical protein